VTIASASAHSISYPVVAGIDNARDVNKIITDEVSAIFRTDRGIGPGSNAVTYEIKRNSGGVLSITFDGDVYEPTWPHPNRVYAALSIDVSSARRMTLGQQVVLGDKLFATIAREFAKQFSTGPGGEAAPKLDDASPSWRSSMWVADVLVNGQLPQTQSYAAESGIVVAVLVDHVYGDYRQIPLSESQLTRTEPLATGEAAAAPTQVAVLSPMVFSQTGGRALAKGWTVEPASSPGTGFDCSAATAADYAVSGFVFDCGVSAADACWLSDDETSVSCLGDDPLSRKLFEYPLNAQTAPDPVVTEPVAHPIPIVLALADGDTCRARSGGSWGPLAAHPDWAGFYTCGASDAVWAPPEPASFGIDQSTSPWTVQVGAADGTGALRAVAVTDAYYVS